LANGSEISITDTHTGRAIELQCDGKIIIEICNITVTEAGK